MSDIRIQVAAEAMWRHRAREYLGVLSWSSMSWRNFCLKKPDIAQCYLDNARVMIKALDGMAKQEAKNGCERVRAEPVSTDNRLLPQDVSD